MTTITTRHCLLLCSLLPIVGCADEQLRDLGYTTDPSTRADDLSRTPEAPPECEQRFVRADQQTSLAADDLAAVSAEDRPFMRYLSLADRLDAGQCLSELEQAVFAAAKVVNMLSWASDVAKPTPVGAEPVLVRVDLRDYDWIREVTLRGQTFSDVWEAMIGVNPFAVELGGEAGSFLSAEARTRVPVLSLNAFIGLVSEPDVYYALLGMPATLGEVRQSVGLPSELDPLEQGTLRTAMQFSRILRPGGKLRVLDRYSIQSPAAGSYHEASHVDTGTFLADPLQVQPDVQRLIAFTLPNGLLAFTITDALGQRVGSGELVLDTNRNDFVATVPTSCSNCHAQGFIPGIDDARAAILGSPELFDPALVAAYEASPNDEARAAQTQADSEVYLAALESAGGGTGVGADPVSAQFVQFSNDVNLEGAAAALLVTPDELLARIGELEPGLLPLALDLTVSSPRFGELYAGAFCGVHASDENPPSGCP